MTYTEFYKHRKLIKYSLCLPILIFLTIKYFIRILFLIARNRLRDAFDYIELIDKIWLGEKNVLSGKRI